MRFTLIPECKKNRQLYITLTAAIHHRHGTRSCDGALPLGAYYNELSPQIWDHIEGIWYTTRDEYDYSQRAFDPEVINMMILGIEHGVQSVTPNRQILNWIMIDENLELQLPN